MMRVLLVLLSALLPLSLSAAEKLNVVTSFTVLADLTQQIGGEHVQVVNLAGADHDPATYQPGAEDAKRVGKARLIVENGLGLEPWLDKLVTSAGATSRVVVASKGATPRPFDPEGKTAPDAYAWNSIANAQLYANNIATALIAADPDNAKAYASNAKNYARQAHLVMAQSKARFANLPQNGRHILVTSEGEKYLGHPYTVDIEVAKGLPLDRELNANEVASLISQIKQNKTDAVFVDNLKDPAARQKVIEQTGVRFGGPLRTRSLAASGPAATYLGAYQANMDTLYNALLKP
jgi:zinc/manganese transport system substrate-binding protein